MQNIQASHQPQVMVQRMEAAQQAKKKKAQPSLFLLVMKSLIDALTVMSHGLQVQSKQTSAGAAQMQAINKESANLTLVPIPNEVRDKHNNVTNEPAIVNAQIHNQQVSQMRQVLNGRVGILQQSSHISMTNVNTSVQSSSLLYSEASGTLGTWRKLTFSANLTQPV